MSEISVSLRMDEAALKSLRALARIDKNGNVGHQIRTAVNEYLEKRKEEVQKELAVMEKEEIDMLNALMGKSEAE